MRQFPDDPLNGPAVAKSVSELTANMAELRSVSTSPSLMGRLRQLSIALKPNSVVPTNTNTQITTRNNVRPVCLLKDGDVVWPSSPDTLQRRRRCSVVGRRRHPTLWVIGRFAPYFVTV